MSAAVIPTALWKAGRFRQRRRAELRHLGFAAAEVELIVKLEIARAVLRANRAGASCAAIGRAFDLSRDRIRQMRDFALRVEQLRPTWGLEEMTREMAPAVVAADMVARRDRGVGGSLTAVGNRKVG